MLNREKEREAGALFLTVWWVQLFLRRLNEWPAT